ncbi:MAG: hypothetical protein FWG42_09910 [Clostridiales bacterium]|nr:hypothetical protein [Clostridiales bacterium]
MSQTVVFHGTGHRAGCTMTAQCVAELVAKEKKELMVLFAALNGRRSTEYLSENSVSVDEFKIQLKSGMGIDKGMLSPSKKAENLYIIAGIDKEEEARHFFPDMAEAMGQSLFSKFDLVVIDSGSDLDNGLAVGAVKMKGLKYLVIEQTESAVRRCEKMMDTYEKLGVSFDKCILSKFVEGDPYTLNYVSSRLSADKSRFMEVSYSDKGRVSEMEYKTLLETGSDKYRSDILKIANSVMEAMNLDSINLRRKRTWNSFI